MKLIEALNLIRQDPRAGAQTFKLQLVTGFQPLHLKTFLEAWLRQAMVDRRPALETGLYGDFWGNLGMLESSDAEAGIVVLEWGDLEPRLGLRNLGHWTASARAEILLHAKTRLLQLVDSIRRAARERPVAFCLPTLPFPPIGPVAGWQSGAFELQLREHLAIAAQQIAQAPNVRLVSGQYLDQISPLRERLDVKSELNVGFPYRLPHASALAQVLTRLVHPAPPKKGLITDLDNTVWSGILGEIGFENVTWDLEHGAHAHGMYQRMLHALAESGVLIGVASKNEKQAVELALERKDLLLPRSAVFPVEANWGAKSESVDRILRTWNIAADAVVFIDDSPMELAEVQARHPAMECLLFPAHDPQDAVELLFRLRELFGKRTVFEEDKIRLESIRRAHEPDESGRAPAPDAAPDTTPEAFLAQAEAELTFSFSKEPLDERAFELVNKTNQFNLNGKRYSEGSWRSYLKDPDVVLLVGSYRDKYGPLGKVSVLAGRKQDSRLLVDVWVMSCRAFSRRIEDTSLSKLLEKTGVEELSFDFQATEKNGVIRDFLGTMLGRKPDRNCQLRREDFHRLAPKTFHRVLEVSRG